MDHLIKIKIILCVLLLMSGCINKKNIYIQNKTNKDILVHRRIVMNDYDRDYILKLKNSNYSVLETDTNSLIIDQIFEFKKDSLLFINTLNNNNKNGFTNDDYDKTYIYTKNFLIISGVDTISIDENDILLEINKQWNQIGPKEKKKRNEIIWNITDSFLIGQ